MAQTDNRDAKQRDGVSHTNVVASAQHVYVGSAVGVKPADGLLYKMGAHVTLRAVGVSREEVTGDGVLTCDSLEGAWQFENSSGTDAIGAGDIGAYCYAVDDNTVAKTDGAGTRAPMGEIMAITSSGKIVVKVGVGHASVDEAQPSFIELDVDTLVGTGVYRTVSPIAGKIRKIWSVTDGVLTTGDATMTAKIGTTAVTGGVITVTQAGSAAGDVDSASPSAANDVAVGDVLSMTVGGTNATATKAKVTFVIDPS